MKKKGRILQDRLNCFALEYQIFPFRVNHKDKNQLKYWIHIILRHNASQKKIGHNDTSTGSGQILCNKYSVAVIDTTAFIKEGI